MYKRLGCRADTKDIRDLVYSVPRVVLPPKVDLRPGCPPVYDQGNLGSCTANAIAAAIEYDRKRQSLDDWTPSRLQIYWNERNLEDTILSDAGAEIRDGIKTVNSLGAAHESLWPYDISKFTDTPPELVIVDAKLHPTVSYVRVPLTLASVRQCLATQGPIVIGISVYESFMSNAVSVTGAIPMPLPTESLQGGHAILLVGYDDATHRVTFRNSWSESWGDKGYGYLFYDYITDENLASDAWSILIVS